VAAVETNANDYCFSLWACSCHLRIVANEECNPVSGMLTQFDFGMLFIVESLAITSPFRR